MLKYLKGVRPNILLTWNSQLTKVSSILCQDTGCDEHKGMYIEQVFNVWSVWWSKETKNLLCELRRILSQHFADLRCSDKIFRTFSWEIWQDSYWYRWLPSWFPKGILLEILLCYFAKNWISFVFVGKSYLAKACLPLKKTSKAFEDCEKYYGIWKEIRIRPHEMFNGILIVKGLVIINYFRCNVFFFT